jgi:hypothetical protein
MFLDVSPGALNAIYILQAPIPVGIYEADL